jgi:exonuclease III
MHAPAYSLDITTWNLQHMMSPTIFDEWALFCKKYDWNEDNVKAAGVDKPKRLTYCNAHNGQLFPTTMEESKPLQTKAAFAEKVAALVKRRAELNSDIFALQEVSDEGAVASIFPPAQWNIIASKAEISQNIAFAVRKDSGVKIISSKQIDELAQEDEGGRKVRPGLQLIIEVSGKRMALLNVHLKAACRGQPISEPRRPGYADNKRWRDIQQGCAVMRKQVPVLENWIESQARAKMLFMIVGDWNRDFKRDLPLPARLDGDESPQLPLTPATRVGSMLKEISDNEPEGAWVALIMPSIQARKKDVKAADQKSAEKVCHQGIDNFALSESLIKLLGVDRKSLKATGVDYGDTAYGVDKAMPSDHCPVTLKLAL